MTEIFKVWINGNEQGFVEFDSYAEKKKYENAIKKEHHNIKFIIVERKQNIVVHDKTLKKHIFPISNFSMIESAETMIRNAKMTKKDTRIVRTDKGILRDFQY